MIANYRVQAELTAVESTEDGKALVLGTVDGCVSVLAILDGNKTDMKQYLAEMPSRDEGVRGLSPYYFCFHNFCEIKGFAFFL